MDLAPAGSIAVRFSPLSAAKLQVNAQQTFDWDAGLGLATPRFGVSVRADVRQDGESTEDVVRRLCTTARLGGKVVSVVTAEELAAEGFVLIADPDDEDPLHHLIGSGDLTAMPDAVRLATLIDTNKQNRPQPTTEGTA